MKLKILTGISIVAIVITLFSSSNLTKSAKSNNTDLSSLIAINIANAEDPQSGGSFGNYDERKVTNECSTTWSVGFWSEEVSGTYYICVEGDEWFCNKGCYAPGESPS